MGKGDGGVDEECAEDRNVGKETDEGRERGGRDGNLQINLLFTSNNLCGASNNPFI